MVAAWKGTPERRKAELFMSEVGYAEPVTATLDFQPAGANAASAMLVREQDRHSVSYEEPRDHQP